MLQWCSSPCSSLPLIVSTETPKSRAGSLTWAHTQRTPFSDSSGDLGHQHDANPHQPGPVSERPSLLGKPHAGLRAESSRSFSSFCSNPPEDWPESGRDQGAATDVSNWIRAFRSLLDESLNSSGPRGPGFKPLTHSRHRTATGGHHRTPSWSISYSRGGRRSLSDTGGHVPGTVRP